MPDGAAAYILALTARRTIVAKRRFFNRRRWREPDRTLFFATTASLPQRCGLDTSAPPPPPPQQQFQTGAVWRRARHPFLYQIKMQRKAPPQFIAGRSERRPVR